jgi:hypothetical protein
MGSTARGVELTDERGGGLDPEGVAPGLAKSLELLAAATTDIENARSRSEVGEAEVVQNEISPLRSRALGHARLPAFLR